MRRHRGRLIAFFLALLFAGGGAAMLLVTAEAPRSEEMLFGQWRLRHAMLALILGLLAVAALCRATGRSAYLGFWVTLVPVALFVAVLELAGRTGLINWHALLNPAPASAEGVGWSLQPGLKVSGETGQDIATRLGLPHDPIPFEFHADGYGFRNGDEPEGEVIFLGDSIVLGAAIPARQTLTEVAEDRLGTPVMQAALLGLAIQAQHEMLLKAGISLEGKTVIQFLFEGNDLLDSAVYRRPVADVPEDTAAGASLLKLVWSRLVPISNPPAPYYTCRIDGQTVAFLWTRRSFEGVEGEAEPITEAIDSFRATLSERGARYALVFVPTKYRVLHRQCRFPDGSPLRHAPDHLSQLPGQIDAWSKSSGLPMLDLTPALTRAAEDGPLPWLWGDTHLSAAGHAAAGAATSEWMRAQGLR